MMFAVVELMGHRTRAGAISDATMGGATLLRIEHPHRPDHTGEEPLTEYYAPSAIFSIRPCSADEATAVAARSWADPALLWAEPSTRPALSPALEELVHLDQWECGCAGPGHDPDCDDFDPHQDPADQDEP